MYINDVHILFYVIIAILGLIIGQIIDWLDKRLPDYKKIISKDIIKEYKESFKPNYILMFLTAIIYVTLLYRYGIQDTT